jgi:hypothetical protein
MRIAMRDYPAPDPLKGREILAQAMAAGQAGRWQEAGRGMRDAGRAYPDQSVTARGMLECATQLVRAGVIAPGALGDFQPRAAGRISVIVCSINPIKLARLRADLARHLHEEDWELVHIDDARSLCEGNARGLARCSGDLIVLCHDDIGILCDRFADRLRKHLAQYDLIGVAGTDRLTGPAWGWAGTAHAQSWVAQPHESGGIVISLMGAYGAKLEGAQGMDGLFIAGHRQALLQLGFDAVTFDDFFLYDLDLSWRAHRAGLKCAITPDIVLEHASVGNYGDRWKLYADRFVEKFPELTPPGPAAKLHSGGQVVREPELIAPIYAWIAHWLNEEPMPG